MADTSNQESASSSGADDASRPPIALPEGTVLREEYRVEGVLGMGSFGITYRAVDQHLQADVAIKEYYPRHIAGRSRDSLTVRPHSSDATEEFEYGLEQFMEEGRTIARFDHPNVVDVRSYFEENGTGYLVMDYYEGQSLASYLAEQGGRLPEEEAVGLMQDVLSGLQQVHEGGVLHRDVDPHNVYRTTEGRALLIDFGAAREAVGQRSQQLSVILKPGYAPVEQYGKGGDQGPPTDVYACAATLYRCLTGLTPPEATDRMQEDNLAPPREVRPEVSFERSVAVMKGLALQPEERLMSAEEFASLLSEESTEAEDTVEVQADGTTIPTTGKTPSSGPEGSGATFEGETSRSCFNPTRIGLAMAAVLLVGVGALFYPWVFSSDGRASSKGEASTRSVAVLPFEVSGAGTQAWRDGMVTMLSMNLDGAGGLRAIPDRRIFAVAEQVDSSALGNQSPALAVAERAGAQYAVIGSAVQLGGTLRLGAEVHTVGTGDRLDRVEVQGAPDSVTALTDRLTRKVLGVLLEKSDARIPSVDMASITTESLDALNAFLQGEQHYRANEYGAAVDDYEAAVADDSTFALAYARLNSARYWAGEGSVGAAIRKAYNRSTQLPRRERRLIRGIHLWSVQNRPLVAADSLRRLSEAYPDDPSVWYWLGEVVYHDRIPRGFPEAETAFKRAIRLDPGVPAYHHHHVELAFVLHHDSSLANRRIEAHPAGPRKGTYRLAWDLVFGTDTRRKTALARLDTVPAHTTQQLFNAIRHPTDGDVRAAVLPKLIERGLPNFSYFLVTSSLGQGKADTALAQMRTGRFSPSWSTCLSAWSMSLGVPLPDSVLQTHLEPSKIEAGADPDQYLPDQYLCAGFYLVDQGRSEDLSALFDRLRTAAAEEGMSTADIQRRVDEVKGYRAFRAGNLERADTLWAGQQQAKRWGAIWRGDLYRERGQLEKAEGWYQAAWRHPVAHERLGQLYDEMGTPKKARAAYQRFVEAWTDADPALQPRVEKARQRLTALAGPPATE